MNRAGVFVALSLAFCPGQVQAHAFQAGSGIYDQFVEGTAVALSAPEIVLCLLPLGLFVGTWKRDGMVVIWPYLLAGQAAGLFLAVAAPPTAPAYALGLGAVTATLAALRPGPPVPAPQIFAVLTGLLASIASFEGHGLFELPAGIHAGLLFGANLAVAAMAGLAAATLERWPFHWLRIGWRVAASWLAAVALMVLAFEMRPFLAS